MKETKKTASDEIEKEFEQAIEKYISNGGNVLAVYGCDDEYTLRIEGNKNTFANNITDFILKDKDVKYVFAKALHNAFNESKMHDIQIHNQRSVKN